jgi:hypothetical protein
MVQQIEITPFNPNKAFLQAISDEGVMISKDCAAGALGGAVTAAATTNPPAMAGASIAGCIANLVIGISTRGFQ